MQSGTFTVNATGSNSNTVIHYRGYATNAAGTSYTSDATFTTYKVAPTNFPTGLNVTFISPTSFVVNWTDATGGTVPDGYLIYFSTSALAFTPANGTTYPSDGITYQNITPGTQTYLYANLTNAKKYYFGIWPYTNSGSQITYLTGAEPNSNATTLANPTWATSANFATSNSLTPQYMGSTTGLLPVIFQATVSGLSNNTTYRYYVLGGVFFMLMEDQIQQIKGTTNMY